MTRRQKKTGGSLLVAMALSAVSPIASAASNSPSMIVQIPCTEESSTDQLLGLLGLPKKAPLPTWILPSCGNLHTQGGIFNGRLEWYSGATLMYVENGPFAVSGREDQPKGSLWLVLEGNHNAANFEAAYGSPQSILEQPDVHLKLYASGPDGDHGANDVPTLIYDAPYRPQGSALWAKHSEDSIAIIANVTALQSSIAVETSRARAAELSLSSALTAEIARAIAAESVANPNGAAETAARLAGDASLQSSIAAEAAARTAADSVLQSSLAAEAARAIAAESSLSLSNGAESARATAAESSIAANLSQEIADRKSGDAATLASAKSYTDSQIAAVNAATGAIQGSLSQEIANRQSGDSVTLSSANGFTSTQVANEAAARGNAISSLNASLLAFESLLELPGTVNAAGNPVDWTELKNVPATALGYAAGAGISVSAGPTPTIANTGVLSVGASGVLSSSGGQNPNISLSGVVPTANGGTNLSSYVAGDVLYASAANTLARLPVGSAGQVLTVNGGAPSWTTPVAGSTRSCGATLYPGINLAECDLTGVNWNNKDLTGANLVGINAPGLYINNGSVVVGANFTGANLNGAYLYSNSIFIGANFTGADLTNAYLYTGANFTGANFTAARLSGAYLYAGGIFVSANFSGADLSNTFMYAGADFSGANFSGANLRGASIWNSATWTSANFTGANLTGANLQNISGATWYNTTCPGGTNSSNYTPQTCIGH